MLLKQLPGFVLITALLYLNATMATGQVPPQETVWEFRPKLVSAIDLVPRTRLETRIEF
jgi:hypothetical protein